MIIELNTDNHFYVKGHVARLNSYGKGKAMNITVAVHKGNDLPDDFTIVKSLKPTQFENLTVGMAVEIYGHIGPASWKDEKGEIHYKDNNDLIADWIEYNETKKTTMQREVKKLRS